MISFYLIYVLKSRQRKIFFVNFKIVYLKLEDGDFVSVEAGDLCRGIFSDGASTYTDTKDSCGFELKDLLFTSYFKVLAVSSKSFTYELKEGSKDPCPYMKFA